MLSTPEQKNEADRVAGLLRDSARAVFARARMHTPADITAEAMSIVMHERIDGTIAIGGGPSDTELIGDFRAYVVTSSTAGNVQVRFAQNTSNATASILRAGSFLLGRQLT